MATPIQADLSGMTAIVTGATGGIGREIARGLARAGAHVVIGARNRERGEATRTELEKLGPGGATVLAIDVSDFASIRAFVGEFEKKFPKLHILVNNAGAWFTDRRESGDHRELTLATNVLGPYLLTKLLAGRLRTSAPARVVNIVSAFASDYDASDLQWSRRKWDGFKAYGQSKQALRMLTWGQAKHFAGSGVTVNAAAPGFVKSDFNQNARGFLATMIGISAKLFAVSPEKGAATPLWVATGADLVGQTGKYFDGHKEKDGKFREEGPIADLEKRCEEMVG